MSKRLTRGELFDAEFLRRLRHLAAAGRRILTGAAGGAHRATDLGDGLEFADYRAYSPGDELRYVDWNVFGRLDRLQVRLFHRHSEQQVHLLLDCSGSMAVGAPGKEPFAKRCAAGLAYLAWTNLDHVHVSAWGGPGGEGSEGSHGELAPLRGRASRFSSVLDYLADLELGGTCSLADAAADWSRRPRPRGLAVVISDCVDVDDLSAALRRLRHAGQQLAVLHVYSPADAGATPDGPVALADPEQPGAAVRADGGPALRSAYAAVWARYLAHVRSAARSAGGVHLHTATDRPWEKFLLSALRLMRLAAV